MMKKLLAAVIAMMLICTCALADPMPLGDNLYGTACWPEGSDADTAVYVYRYSYPTVAGSDDFAEMVNEFYAYTVEDSLAFTVPIMGESMDPSDVQASTDIVASVTCNNDDFLSILVVNTTLMGAAASCIYSSQTFARTGSKAGNVISLPYLLGILDSGDTADEWMETRQTAKADDCVRQLVWEVIQDQMADGSAAYYDDLTYDQLCGFFYPEEDFYLDADGNPVFFIEESMAAPQTEGVLLFPFSLDEILDEI